MSERKKFPKSQNVTKVTIETSEGTWVLKKKSSILEWSQIFQRDMTVHTPPKKKGKPKKRVSFSNPIKKVKKIPARSSSSFEDEESSESQETSEDDPKTPGGYAKLHLSYKVEDGDPMKAAQKMAKNMKGRFTDH